MVISFFEIIKILKLSKTYIISSTSASMLLMFHFSLYFPLVYLQFLFCFISEYLWGFAISTAPHLRLHPSVSIIK